MLVVLNRLTLVHMLTMAGECDAWTNIIFLFL